MKITNIAAILGEFRESGFELFDKMDSLGCIANAINDGLGYTRILLQFYTHNSHDITRPFNADNQLGSFNE